MSGAAARGPAHAPKLVPPASSLSTWAGGLQSRTHHVSLAQEIANTHPWPSPWSASLAAVSSLVVVLSEAGVLGTSAQALCHRLWQPTVPNLHTPTTLLYIVAEGRRCFISGGHWGFWGRLLGRGCVVGEGVGGSVLCLREIKLVE